MDGSNHPVSSSPNPKHDAPSYPDGILPPGTIIDSSRYPGAQSILLEDRAHYENAQVIGERVYRDWEYVTVTRPVDLHEKIVEVPTTRTVQTLVPNIQVREVIKSIPKDEIEYKNKFVEIHHKKIVDKYVEVPVVLGTETKYVPKIEIQERTVKVTKPEVKWIEKVVEIPQVKEVVRYIESDRNVETVIRYVPKKDSHSTAVDFSGEQPEDAHDTAVNFPEEQPKDTLSPSATPYSHITGAMPGVYTPSNFVSLTHADNHKIFPHSMPTTPRLDRVEQLFIPRVEKTVEVEKQVPVTVNVSVPFMVPKPVQVPVEVPVLKFRDHFVPVPIRRHVKPRIIFTDEVYEVECAIEKPILVIKDYYKPVPVDVKIKLQEKDIKVIPIDVAEISQADFHAMWMRVNADLLESSLENNADFAAEYKEKLAKAARMQVDGHKTEAEDAHLSEEEKLARLEARQNGTADDGSGGTQLRGDRGDEDQDSSRESIHDPSGPIDLGPLPLHPGHPLMMTFLQNQWIQNPSTITHNMYTPELFRLHASTLDNILHPQPHQVNITHEQSIQLGPLPAEMLPNPWLSLDAISKGRRQQNENNELQNKTSANEESTLFYEPALP